MIWCSNCIAHQLPQSARSSLVCCNGCGKVVIQQADSKRTSSRVAAGQCEREVNSLNADKSLKVDVAKLIGLRPTVSKNAKYSMSSKCSDDSGSLSDIDNVEVRSYLLKEEETILKQMMWERMNKGYAKAEAARKAAAANALKLKKEKRRQMEESKKGGDPSKAAKKRTSSRVNYDALKDLLGESELASDSCKKSRTDWYSEDDATSSKNESEHNNYQNDQYPDYEEEQYDDDDGFF